MRVFLSNFITAVVAFTLISSHRASAAIPVDVDDLDPLKECKRRDVKLFESNNKVYMYGGQSWVKNGTVSGFQIANHYLRIADFTSARDLSDPSILTAKDIPGNITIFQLGAFWVDEKKVYIVGGAVNDEPWLSRQGEFLPSNYSDYRAGTIFSYEIEADKWASESALQPSSGSGARDSFCCGSFAYNVQHGRAYFYSGTNGAGARRLEPDSTPVYVGYTNEETFGNSNLLTFDTASFRWANVTTDKQLTTTGTEGGQLVYLPGTESSSGGIAVALGGLRRDTQQMESLRQVLLYDSGSDNWYSQVTTADDDFPPGRWYFCAVAGSAPDNSSHNVYVHGGEASNVQGNAFSDMWILSIPSFHWSRVDVDSVPKKSLGCTTVAQRYMVTYGGVSVGWGEEGDEDVCDQDNYGLRLFDMSSLAWTSTYDGPPSEEHAFKVPKLVYGKIGGNEEGSATQTAPTAGFETPGLASLFQKSNPTSTSSTTPPSHTGSDHSAKKQTNVGAIAGGVVGGVALIALLAIGAFCLMKRRKRHAYDPASVSAPYEAHGQSAPMELTSNPQGQKVVYELYDGHHGTPGNAPPQELYADHPSPLPQHATPDKQHPGSHI